jgi:uncharacterized protein YggU (UPF0235/DUF167 family)
MVAGGISLAVRLTPKGGRDAIEGTARLADGRAVLKVRVAAPANKGEANEALTRLIAKAVAVPQRDVVLAGGASARLKRLTVAGAPSALVAALEKMVAVR